MRWLLTDHQASWVFRWIWNQGGRKGKLDLCVSQEEFLGGQHNMHLDVEPARTEESWFCIIWPVSDVVDICHKKRRIGDGHSRPFRGSVILIEFMRSAGKRSNYGWLTPSLSSENELRGRSQTVGSMIRGRRDSSTFRGGGDKKNLRPPVQTFSALVKILPWLLRLYHGLSHPAGNAWQKTAFCW